VACDASTIPAKRTALKMFMSVPRRSQSGLRFG
jgi:hypothetical protein